MKKTFLAATVGVLTTFSQFGWADTIAYGSNVHLKNLWEPANTYLDTRGRVQDKPEFSAVTGAYLFVSTSSEKNRDQGSGSWQVLSSGDQSTGNLKYGDTIRLKNNYPDAGYLDTNYTLNDLPAYKNADGVQLIQGAFHGVFTTNDQQRLIGSTTDWVVYLVKDGQVDETATGEVQSTDVIQLDNAFEKDSHLDTHGYVKYIPAFEDYKEPSVLNVFTVQGNDNRDAGSTHWVMEPVTAP